ncbi:MAG: TerB family tellurite resistance protein [Tildeniella nuda ZEHNDER 1965/U140]|nr:TerB family tellurite resistance protein [Tildeniella nuda ZEHNDER 1965/U140]
MESEPRLEPTLPLDDARHLEKLKSTIERAIADGKLTAQEMQTIKAIIWSNGKVSPEELDLVRELIHEKVANGEIVYDWT